MKIMSLASTQTLYFERLVCTNIRIMTMQICNVGTALNSFNVVRRGGKQLLRLLTKREGRLQ